MKVENIIFDLCGPICDIDVRRIVDSFQQQGVSNAEALFLELPHKSFIKEFEAGKISANTFREKIRESISLNLSDESIDKAWNACFVRLPKKHVELLGILKLKYRLFLLSNSDEINYKFFKETFEKQLGFNLFQVVFTDSFVSCQTGIRKPSPESFMQIIEKHNLSAENTLFIDDSPRNVEGARSVSIKSHLLEKTEDIQDLFDCCLNVKTNLFV